MFVCLLIGVKGASTAKVSLRPKVQCFRSFRMIQTAAKDRLPTDTRWLSMRACNMCFSMSSYFKLATWPD